MKTPFDIVKAAQVAHLFITRAGGQLEILKLVKLIYLADRQSLELRRTTIVGGTFYSLQHGPVTSEILDLINDGTPTGDSAWETLILDRSNHRVGIVSETSSYDALAPSELRVLEDTWSRFGQHSQWELVEWTHRHCEEWTDPRGGRNEIQSRKLAESFAWKPSEIEDFETELAAQCRLQEMLN